MRYVFFFAAFFVSGFMASHVFGQEVSKYVSVRPADNWVKLHKLPEQEFKLAAKFNNAYRLVDYQLRATQKTKEQYIRIAVTLNTADGVEDNANFSVSFDPTYQSIVFHDLSVIRNGIRINHLKLSDFDLFRMETDRDRLIYNKKLQLALIMSDVRIGDTVDYSYTVHGKNPALGPHIYNNIQLQFSIPVQRLYDRTLVPKGMQISKKPRAGGDAPKLIQSGGWKEYIWSTQNIVALDADDNRPDWHSVFPGYELSSFKNWSDVGRFFAPAYEAATDIPPELETKIAEIMAQSSDPKKRTRAALEFVQREIRYLGIELGAGGLVPRKPALVLERRFGDCKDMTLLLTTMLSAMDIKAANMWVDTELRAGVQNRLPSYRIFDHVIVKVDIGNAVYFLDPTKGQQLGSLDTLEQGAFGKGLLITENSTGLIDAYPKGLQWSKDFVDTFDLVSSPDTVFYSIKSNYYGKEADAVKTWLQRDGEKGLDKALLKYYQDSYPNIKTKTALRIDLDDDLGRLTLIASYEIPKAWTEFPKDNQKTFEVLPDELLADFPGFDGATRTTPYKIDHPIKTKQTIEFILDSTWNIKNSDFRIDNESFSFSKSAVFKDEKYTETYEYKTKTDSIDPKNFKKTMQNIQNARAGMGVNLQQPMELSAAFSFLTPDAFSEKNITIATYVWIFFAVIISIIFAIFTFNHDREWRGDGLFYPVRTSKFLLLSALTIGYYQFYWVYKNWLWIKTVQGEDLSPGWRTFFANITNFSLFPRIGYEQQKGYAWYAFWATPLALLILLNKVLSSMSTRIESLPNWIGIVGLLSFILFIPVTLQVEKMNENHPEIIKKNSKYGWRSIGVIILFLPVSLLMVAGVIVTVTEMFE